MGRLGGQESLPQESKTETPCALAGLLCAVTGGQQRCSFAHRHNFEALRPRCRCCLGHGCLALQDFHTAARATRLSPAVSQEQQSAPRAQLCSSALRLVNFRASPSRPFSFRAASK